MECHVDLFGQLCFQEKPLPSYLGMCDAAKQFIENDDNLKGQRLANDDAPSIVAALNSKVIEEMILDGTEEDEEAILGSYRHDQ